MRLRLVVPSASYIDAIRDMFGEDASEVEIVMCDTARNGQCPLSRGNITVMLEEEDLQSPAVMAALRSLVRGEDVLPHLKQAVERLGKRMDGVRV